MSRNKLGQSQDSATRLNDLVVFFNCLDLYHKSLDSGERQEKSWNRKRRFDPTLAPSIRATRPNDLVELRLRVRFFLRRRFNQGISLSLSPSRPLALSPSPSPPRSFSLSLSRSRALSRALSHSLYVCARYHALSAKSRTLASKGTVSSHQRHLPHHQPSACDQLVFFTRFDSYHKSPDSGERQ